MLKLPQLITARPGVVTVSVLPAVVTEWVPLPTCWGPVGRTCARAMGGALDWASVSATTPACDRRPRRACKVFEKDESARFIRTTTAGSPIPWLLC